MRTASGLPQYVMAYWRSHVSAISLHRPEPGARVTTARGSRSVRCRGAGTGVYNRRGHEFAHILMMFISGEPDEVAKVFSNMRVGLSGDGIVPAQVLYIYTYTAVHHRAWAIQSCPCRAQIGHAHRRSALPVPWAEFGRSGRMGRRSSVITYIEGRAFRKKRGRNVDVMIGNVRAR